VQDSKRHTLSANLAITISATVVSTPAIMTKSLLGGTAGTPYSAALAVSGGAAPYQWAVSSGSLPQGLTLGITSGAITGTPSSSGTSAFTVQVRDSKQQPASANLAITISATGGSTPAITTDSLVGGSVGKAYSAALAVSGGAAPYQWAVSSGSLPQGLTLGTTSGAITGTPSSSGTYAFTIQVRDSKQQPASANLAITITASSTTLAVTTNSLPGGNVGTAYSATLSAAGGTPPYHWAVTSGNLPTTLSLSSGTGVLSGIPSTPGTFNGNVQVTDSSSPQATASASVSLVISPAGPPPGAVSVAAFGATGNGTTDDTAAINSAMQSLQPGQTLYFPCGTYAISQALKTINLTDVTVQGPAPGTGAICAGLQLTGSASFTALDVRGQGLSNPAPLVADTTSNTFRVGTGGLAALGITPGSYVLVSDTGVASNGPTSPLMSNQEVVKVTAVSGDTATIENTFSHDFTLISPYPNSQGCCPYVQKIVNPATGVAIRYLNIDASRNTGPATRAMQLAYAANSEIGNLQISNFLGQGNSGGLRMDVGYQNNLHDVTCNVCGNGGANGLDSVGILRQSLLTAQNITIKNTAAQSVFSFGLRMTHFSTIRQLMVDAGGANGRPIKLLRSSNNTITDATAKNGTGGHNGISVTDMSTYNTFNNCAALNNSNIGIALFGNHNIHNTFNNCTSQFNESWQFGQVNAADGTFTDYYTTVNGGKFCCARGASAIIEVKSDHFTITGTTISDDQGLSIDGLVIIAGESVVENNTFSGFPSGRDIYAVTATNPSFSGNSTPDGTTPSGLATVFRKVKSLYAALRHPLSPGACE
jgi:hypothetical protein